MSKVQQVEADRREIMGRQHALSLGSLLAAGGTAIMPHQLGSRKVVAAPSKNRRDLLVVIFLRGAADCLNIVVPHGDPEYYRVRPNIAIARPGSGTGTALDLDGFFGLHPKMASLKPLWDDRRLAVIHAAGSPDDTHSHFDAMQYMECGTPGNRLEATGWLSRHLQSTRSSNDSVFRALSIGGQVPQSLRGQVLATAISNLQGFALSDDPAVAAQLEGVLGSLYSGDDLLRRTGHSVIGAIRTVRSIPLEPRTTNPPYPDSDLARGLTQVASVARADIGMEIAWLDYEGWDTHVNEGGADGQMANLLQDLSESLAAFVADLEAQIGNTTIVVMTEFGRRVEENGLGTDHGHGGTMLVLGGAVRGGHVYLNNNQWPGLKPENLYGPGDLAVTTDFRSVLAEVTSQRLYNPNLATVFPNFTPTKVGLFG